MWRNEMSWSSRFLLPPCSPRSSPSHSAVSAEAAGLCGRAASPSRSVAGSMTANLPTSSAFASSCPGRTSSELPCASEQRCGGRSERSPQFPAFSSSRGQSVFRSACFFDQLWRFPNSPAGCPQLCRRHSWLDDRSGLRQYFRDGAVDPRTEHDPDDEFRRLEGLGIFPVPWRAHLPPSDLLARFTLPPTGSGTGSATRHGNKSCVSAWFR